MAGYNLTDQALGYIKGEVSSFCIDIIDIIKKLSDNWSDMADKYRYSLMLDCLNKIINMYHEVYLECVKKQLETIWLKDISYSRTVEKLKGSSDSVETARQLETELYYILETVLLRVETINLTTLDDVDFSEDCFDSILNVLKSSWKEIDELAVDYCRRLIENEDQNILMSNTIMVLTVIYKPLLMFIENAEEIIKNEKENYIQSVKQIVNSSKVQKSVSNINTDEFYNISEFDDDFVFSLPRTGSAHSDFKKKTDVTEEKTNKTKCNGGKQLQFMNNKLKNDILAITKTMYDISKNNSFSEFQRFTKLLYNTICNEITDENKNFSYEIIIHLSYVYNKFYKECGKILRDKFTNQDERDEFINQEYIQVTSERNNDQYFNNEGELWTFRSHAHHTYMVFDRVSDMLANIAKSCICGKANDINLMYGAYVLFTPIIEGHISKKDSEDYSKFSRWASMEINKILGINESIASQLSNDADKVMGNDKSDIDQNKGYDSNDNSNDYIDFTGDNFTQKNLNLAVEFVEKIIDENGGVEKINKYVEKHYSSLVSVRSTKLRNNYSTKSNESDNAISKYGRYTVTKKTVQIMNGLCDVNNTILNKLDEFYKEKFQALNSGFDTINKVIHQISSFMGLFGLNSINLTKIFSKENEQESEDNDKSLSDIIKLCGLSLTSFSLPGKIIIGGGRMLKIVDFMMPYMKKSKILVKLSEKIWNLTRSDIQLPYKHQLMDMYMMEHYEIKHGLKKSQSERFKYYHIILSYIENDFFRRIVENAIFSAEEYLNPNNYILNESNPKKNREICCGVYLNLFRAGLCNKQNITSAKANKIVDRLYDLYVSNENITPRTNINPENKIIG